MSAIPDPFDAHDRLKGSISDLVLALRLAAEDLAQAEPTNIQELHGKLRDLAATVGEGMQTIALAVDVYDHVPEEGIR